MSFIESPPPPSFILLYINLIEKKNPGCEEKEKQRAG